MQNEFSEFDIELNEAEATVFHKIGNAYVVNVVRKPNIIVAGGYGEDQRTAFENAERIAKLLNYHGLEE
jgi:hypothetical protein